MKEALVTIAAVVALAACAATARADMSKPAARADKMPASARVFVLDKDAPATEKTMPLPRTPPTLKQK